MKTFPLTFTGGDTITLPGGNFFIILSTTTPVDVELFKNKVSTDEKAVSVLAGFSVEPLQLIKSSIFCSLRPGVFSARMADTWPAAVRCDPCTASRALPAKSVTC